MGTAGIDELGDFKNQFMFSLFLFSHAGLGETTTNVSL
jgi:hypothetical protein